MERRAFIKAFAVAAAISAFLFVQEGAQAQEEDVLSSVPPNMREQLVKAAYLYNFAKFTTWPSTAFESVDTSLQLCVLGKDPFGDTFEDLEGESVAGRVVSTHYVIWAEEIARCHVLFLSFNNNQQLLDLLRRIQGLPILTVSDMPSFARMGGMIGLKRDNNRIKFEANPKAVEFGGLRVSSKLLRLAEIVETEATVGQLN